MKSIVASMASESSQQKVENRSHLFSGQRILQKLGTLLLALWLLAAVSSVWAAPYSGKAFTYSQPDGSSLQVKLYGDEFFAYQRTLDGYEVVRDAATGYVCYAKLSADGTAFESTGIPAVTAALSGDTCRANALATGTLAPAYTSLPEDVVQERIAAAEVKLGADTKGRRLAAAKTTTKATGRVGAPPASETTGSVVGLCVLVKFKDDPTTVSVYNSVTSSYDTLDTTISQTQVDNFCNGSGYTEFGNACSVNEYFSTQSNGYLNYTNRVLAYVTVPHARSYYDNNSAYNGDKFVTDAMEQVRLAGYNLTDVTLDTYGRIVALNVFYTGTVTADWSYGLWPSTSALSTPKVMSTGITAYAYQMSDMTNELKIGTFCHENGHLVCDFPDLYSYYDSAFICGYYSLMSGGNYGGPSSDGSHPTNIDPYLKYKAGWADVVEVTSTTMLTTSLTCDVNAFYKYTNPNYSTEYFLVENRCNTAGYEETYGPGNGLVVWHINEAGDNTYSSLYYGTYTIPYEAFVVEATPTTLISPWYLYPDVDEYDTFCAERGYDALYDGSTTVSLQFWDHSTNYTGLTVDSGFALCEFGAAGSTTSFYIGAHPKIDSFYLDAGATTADDPVVTLNCVSEGNPAYYRASEYADFRDAQLWQPYSSTDTTTFTLSAGTASKRVYFQLKSSINGLSSIVSDTIMFYMPVLSAFTINKGDAITTVQTVTLNNVCTMSTASE
ncbi:TPA: hypothetical protein DDW35_08095, partial [Candidatus Sumerlaeota bacterium]|nr:hypothetical protein [Candidatus Sumerlaeota bacterium]